MISFLDQDFSALNASVKQINPSQIFILCDENTHEHCLPTLLGNLQTTCPIEILEIEAGEEMKTIETAVQLWEILAEYGADRKSLLLNLGGGVITDLGGFVASTYKRGISFIHIPTTLLAMCDASLGGKTGIDHQFLKNIVGTFSLPERILVYPPFLKTLPFKELRSGFAEMLKHGLIADHTHWLSLSNLEQVSVENITPHIETSMKIKENIINIDFKEQNIRKVLNFGHTIGHAIESFFLSKGNILPHGEAVAAGMICETYLSLTKELLPEPIAHSIINRIRHFYPKLETNWDNETLFSLMLNDKKNTNGKIQFSLISNIGEGLYNEECSKENILSALDFYKALS